MLARCVGFVALLFLAGCSGPAPASDPDRVPRRATGTTTSAAGPDSYLTDELEVQVPRLVGPWAAAFWVSAETGLGCHYVYDWAIPSQSGGTTDMVLMIARGWARPEVVGRIQHQFVRGDRYLGHVTAGPVFQDVKDSTQTFPVSGSTSGRNTVAFGLPPRALVVVGSTYLADRELIPSHWVPLGLSVRCDGEFRVEASVNGTAFRVIGAEQFSGGTQVDTAWGFAVQRDVEARVSAREGLVALLHEDANQGNAQYRTVRPDGSEQVDTLGNRMVVGPAGDWRFGLQRVSVSPGGEFRLFLLDTALPVLPPE